MPPPTVTCKICGETVSKRQSYAYENGRACRVHEGVTEAKDARLEQEKKAAKAHEVAQRNMRRREHGRDTEWLDSHCWVCEEEGVNEREFWTRMLVGSEKQQLSGEKANPLDFGATAKAGGLDGARILKLLPMKGRITIKDGDSRILAQLLGKVKICGECARSHYSDDELAGPQLSLEALSMMGAAYEVSGMRDAVKEQAGMELAPDGAIPVIDEQIIED